MSTINTTHAPSSTQTTLPNTPNGSESNSEHIATLPVASFRICSGVVHLFPGDNPNISQKQLSKIIKLQTIMDGAVMTDNASAAKSVLRHGFNPNNRFIKDKVLYPWSNHVVGANALNILKVLVEHGTLEKVLVGSFGTFEMLHLVVAHQRYEMAELLIEQGADVHAADNDGDTALDFVLKTPITLENCLERERMISLLKKAMELKIEKTIVEDLIGEECLICLDCGDTNDFCKLKCCHQMAHISCIQKWHKLSPNKDCPHCRAALKSVVKIIKKQTWTRFNLRKNVTKGLIYKYISVK